LRCLFVLKMYLVATALYNNLSVNVVVRSSITNPKNIIKLSSRKSGFIISLSSIDKFMHNFVVIFQRETKIRPASAHDISMSFVNAFHQLAVCPAVLTGGGSLNGPAGSH
jgi:hypothetical protein